MCNLRLIAGLTRNPNIIDIISDKCPIHRLSIFRILYTCQFTLFLAIHLLTDCITLYQQVTLL